MLISSVGFIIYSLCEIYISESLILHNRRRLTGGGSCAALTPRYEPVTLFFTALKRLANFWIDKYIYMVRI